MKKEYQKLAQAAEKIKLAAYAPYSHFRVGAALLGKNGRVYTGCNIENSSYGLTICAERVAVFKAITSGASQFKAIVVVSDDPGYTPPCGACRQVLLDLAGNIDFIMKNSQGKYKIVKLASLLPLAFSGKNLARTLTSEK